MPPEADEIEVTPDPEGAEPTGTEPDEIEVPDPEAEEQQPPTLEEQVAAFGGIEKATEALQFRAYLDSAEGTSDFFVQSGLALGLTPAQIEALFDGPPAAGSEDPDDEEDEDRVLTVKEMKALLESTVLKPQQEQRQAEAVDSIRTTIRDEITRLEVSDKVAPVILALADNHLAESDRFNPEAVKAAIAKGLADFTEIQAIDHSKYLVKKAEQRRAAPKPLKGGTAEDAPVEEPKNTEEAKARVRASLRKAGEIE